MGMTWGIKVRSVTFALVVVAVLALASGANWADDLSWLFGL
jgi:hypothetical protein